MYIFLNLFCSRKLYYIILTRDEFRLHQILSSYFWILFEDFQINYDRNFENEINGIIRNKSATLNAIINSIDPNTIQKYPVNRILSSLM